MANARDDALAAVPIGKENRLSARSIWKKTGFWARHTIGTRLQILAAEGIIVRVDEPHPSGIIATFYRETAFPLPPPFLPKHAGGATRG